MRYVDEYRNPEMAKRLVESIRRRVTRPWKLMEVCGGQTHAIVKYGIHELLEDKIDFVHGPGCPVCVTPIEWIDRAIAIASRPGVIFTSFGDMIRVPGSRSDLRSVKARGGDVRIVYSPLDAVNIARRNPDREVVFFAVGFETTAPINALAVHQAHQEQLTNFSVLVSHVLVPPAMESILKSPDNEVDGFLAAGHVCTIMGYTEYEPLARKYGVPIVVTGFEPLDILQGVDMCVRQLEEGRAEVENQYRRSVRREGTRPAQELIREVFRIVPRKWRGIGAIGRSGLALREPYREFDAARRFGVEATRVEEPEECISGEVLRGVKKPDECSVFGTRCTPRTPIGAPMVSSEGACAAYYQHRNTGSGTGEDQAELSGTTTAPSGGDESSL